MPRNNFVNVQGKIRNTKFSLEYDEGFGVLITLNKREFLLNPPDLVHWRTRTWDKTRSILTSWCRF